MKKIAILGQPPMIRRDLLRARVLLRYDGGADREKEADFAVETLYSFLKGKEDLYGEVNRADEAIGALRWAP